MSNYILGDLELGKIKYKFGLLSIICVYQSNAEVYLWIQKPANTMLDLLRALGLSVKILVKLGNTTV